jgi:two-component system sensor histidine kinase HydH
MTTETKHDPIEQGLLGRLTWITAARIALLVLILVAVSVFYLGGHVSHYPTTSRTVFGTIATAFGFAAIFAYLLRGKTRLRRLADAQLVVDQLTWTAVVYVTGGVTSGAVSFYALTSLVGAILVGQRGALVAAISGISVYLLLGVGFGTGVILPPPDQAAVVYPTLPEQIIYPLLVNTLGIVVVALLAGYLAERLRITGGALEEAQRRALEAERLAGLGRLAAGLAHEIRNPLGSISGSIEMLRETPGLSAEDRQLCDIIRKEAGRLNNLVGDMVDLSKPRPPNAAAVDVASIAREVVALAQNDTRASSDVSIDYEGPSGRIGALCDGSQFRQVLWNLVRNAVQASPAGSVVKVTVEQTPADVFIAVTDDGPGFSAEDREKLFDAFYTTRTHGTGIGLAVVKRIIDDHAEAGARLEVESPETGGARFRVRLTPRGADSVIPPSVGR